VSVGVDRMLFEERQELLRLVVDRITVEDETVRIETVIPHGDDYSQFRTRHDDERTKANMAGKSLQERYGCAFKPPSTYTACPVE